MTTSTTPPSTHSSRTTPASRLRSRKKKTVDRLADDGYAALRTLADRFVEIAAAANARGCAEDARLILDLAIPIREQLARDLPDDAEVQHDLATTLSNLACISRALGKNRDAAGYSRCCREQSAAMRSRGVDLDRADAELLDGLDAEEQAQQPSDSRRKAGRRRASREQGNR